MTSEAIGRGDYVLSADFSELEKRLAAAEAAIKESGVEAEKTFVDAGKKAAKGYGEALKVGLKVAAGVASAAFALATKGALELENATASFRAETGATAEAAKRAGQAINAMAGRNLASIAQIGDALSKVHTDLGLVGEEAERATERFLRFARATKQDAAAAVMAFDDILDAWGLEAKESGRIMDLLVASHQKYGGSIDANQAALAALAPSLKAANLQLDDGQALLNLFAASGMDAAAAPQALQKALATIESPAELRRLIDEISQTDDAFLRSQKAADLFGVRAGAKLANALAGANLDDYRLSLAEVEGASDRAADALDSTFSARLQLMVKAVGARLNEVSLTMGPLVTGLASAAMGAAALGLNVAGLIPAIRNVIASLGALKVAVAATGLGLLVLAIGAVAAAASDARPEVEKLREALSAKIPILGWDVLSEAGKNDIVRRISEIEVAQSVQLQNTQAWAVGMRDAFVKSGIPGAVRGVVDAMAAEVAAGRAEYKIAADGLVSVVPVALEAAKNAAVAIARKTPGEIAAGLREKRASWQGAVDQLGTDLENTMTRAAEVAKIQATLAGDNIVKGLKSKDPVVRAQAEETQRILRSRLAELTEDAKGYGQRTGENYAAGILAAKVAARTAAQQLAFAVRDNLKTGSPAKEGPLSELGGPEGWGRKAARGYADGIRSAASTIAAAAHDAAGSLAGAFPGGLAAEMMTMSTQEFRVGGTVRIELVAAPGVLPSGMTAREVAGIVERGVDIEPFLSNLRHAISSS